MSMAKFCIWQFLTYFHLIQKAGRRQTAHKESTSEARTHLGLETERRGAQRSSPGASAPGGAQRRRHDGRTEAPPCNSLRQDPGRNGF